MDSLVIHIHNITNILNMVNIEVLNIILPAAYCLLPIQDDRTAC